MLVLVVGPSGAGKDTLLATARTALAEDTRFRFVRRAITRPADAGGEPHEAVTEADFSARVAAGGFALHWQAHGLRYGIPADIGDDLKQGRVAVANLSRAMIAEAAARFRVRVIEITAPPALLAARLAARGREDADDLARRLARTIELPLPVEREVILNDGPVDLGAARLVAALIRAASGAPPA